MSFKHIAKLDANQVVAFAMVSYATKDQATLICQLSWHPIAVTLMLEVGDRNDKDYTLNWRDKVLVLPFPVDRAACCLRIFLCVFLIRLYSETKTYTRPAI